MSETHQDSNYGQIRDELYELAVSRHLEQSDFDCRDYLTDEERLQYDEAVMFANAAPAPHTAPTRQDWLNLLNKANDFNSGLEDEGHTAQVIDQLQFMLKEARAAAVGKVVVEVSGGVADVTSAPEGVIVEIVDHDNKEDL